MQRNAKAHQSHTEIHRIPCEAVDAAGDQGARGLPGLRSRSVGSEHAQGGSDQSEAGKTAGHSKQLNRAGCWAAINDQAKGKQTAENQRWGHEYARIVLTHGRTATTVGRIEALPPAIRGKRHGDCGADKDFVVSSGQLGVEAGHHQPNVRFGSEADISHRLFETGGSQ